MKKFKNFIFWHQAGIYGMAVIAIVVLAITVEAPVIMVAGFAILALLLIGMDIYHTAKRAAKAAKEKK